MNAKQIKKIIRQRTRPNIFDFCYVATKAHLRSFLKFKSFCAAIAKANGRRLKILDVGCGYKPFQELLKKDLLIGEYVGVDFDKNRSWADVEARAEALPLSDNYFDAIIATETLEHVQSLDKAVGEMRRVAKNGALIYISTPFIFPEHGIPYDFQRLTSYKYRDLFKGDEIIAIVPTNNCLATPFYLFNVCWESMAILQRLPLLTSSFYFLNNIIATASEWLVLMAGELGRRLFRKKRKWFNDCFENYFYRMPAGYDVIVSIKK